MHKKEDCEEPACISDPMGASPKRSKSMLNKLLFEDVSDISRDTQCPLTRQTLGNYSWSFLHTLGFSYPEKPNPENIKEMSQFLHLFSKLYPCKICSIHFQADIKKMPPFLENRKDFSIWICKIHNVVGSKD